MGASTYTFRRGSTPNSSDKPSLAVFYESSQQDVMGVDTYVHKKYYPKFSVFEDDLRDLSVSYRDYAYVVTKMLRDWAKDHKFKTVPINVFLGNWALEGYLKVRDSRQVKIRVDDDGGVLDSEVIVGRKFIQDSLVRFVRLRDVVESVRPLLSERWLSMYDGGDNRPTNDAVKILSLEFGVFEASSYTEIVDTLLL